MQPLQYNLGFSDTVEVHYCVVTMQWTVMSFKYSININRIQNVSIRGSSAVTQNVSIIALVQIMMNALQLTSTSYCIVVV